jgi:glycosyltransferase involved in cell wall biosynthesis
VAVDVVIPFFRGASTHVYEVAKHLTKLGHEVHVVSRRTRPAQPSYEVLDGVHIHRVYRGIMAPLPFSTYQRLEKGEVGTSTSTLNEMYAGYLFTIFSLYVGLVSASIIRKYGIEVIIERETSFGAGAVASAITGRPMILEIIGPRYSRRSLNKSKKIFAYTKSMIHEPVPPEKLVFVSAAADVELFKPDLAQRKLVREKYGLQDSVVVGYVGTFAEWHGIKELIDASERILKQHPNSKFLMVGPYFKRAKETTQKLGISRAYVFTGPIPYGDVPKYVNAADILVAPYNPAKSELRKKYGIGSPLKVFEYMACAKPVITTSAEPILQVIREGKTGVTVPAGDSDALSKAVIDLMEKPLFAEKIGKAAREEVEKHYSWKAFAMRLESVLRETMKSA